MKLKCLLNPVGSFLTPMAVEDNERNRGDIITKLIKIFAKPRWRFLTPTAVKEREPLLTETKDFNEKKY